MMNEFLVSCGEGYIQSIFERSDGTALFDYTSKPSAGYMFYDVPAARRIVDTYKLNDALIIEVLE